ncbi:MAG: tetratricopeptide repeat protein, partial [Gemmatimonadota bacterium]|nr:tetratricopeptide repeat protein [Gemmatimonadota bacterium]
FQEAADAYRLAVAEDPDHGMSWFRLGMALHELGVWGGAASAYERAIELGTQSVSARWRLARVRAQAGDSEAAFQALEELASSGFGSVATLSSEAELAGLRDDGRWSDVLQRVQANSEPCMHQEVSRRFDFWIGEWEVFSPQGAPLGENRVESVLVGCALVENWTNTAGRSGKSLNVYDPSLGDPAWRQLYVGDFGGVTDYRDGRWEDGVMHFQARVLGAQGDTLTRHMRFRPVGKDTVQQIIEDEDATGQTTLQFHGVYVRKRAP